RKLNVVGFIWKGDIVNYFPFLVSEVRDVIARKETV
ncbi:MAG: hypothetical protein RLZZ155_93, partial [Bacteroidota bacterium]